MYLARAKLQHYPYGPAEQEKPSLLPGFVTKLYSRVIRLFQVHGTANISPENERYYQVGCP